MTVEDYCAQQTKELRRRVKGYVLHSEASRELSGRNAFVVEHSFPADARIKVRQRQAYVSYGQHIVTMTVSAEAEDFDAMDNAFQTALESLRLGTT